ncbi:Uncharacterized protein C5orf4 like protein [Trachymyrmex septentrionalis]|uniref:Uncharacterized protein C5orf4 like protein n=1 Tax=Trachymyrmex septentrionalis TaxID=34720 RepID=A0A195FIG0_9HYME|nr:Uncharacterized protein C5orf4 like protein [Trachymyrmex septentrionalis]
MSSFAVFSVITSREMRSISVRCFSISSSISATCSINMAIFSFKLVDSFSNFPEFARISAVSFFVCSNFSSKSWILLSFSRMEISTSCICLFLTSFSSFSVIHFSSNSATRASTTIFFIFSDCACSLFSDSESFCSKSATLLSKTVFISSVKFLPSSSFCSNSDFITSFSCVFSANSSRTSSNLRLSIAISSMCLALSRSICLYSFVSSDCTFSAYVFPNSFFSFNLIVLNFFNLCVQIFLSHNLATSPNDDNKAASFSLSLIEWLFNSSCKLSIYAALDLSFQSQPSNLQFHVLSPLHSPLHLVISWSCRAAVAASFCFITSSNSLLPFSNVLKASSIDAFPCSSACIFSCMSSYLNFHSSAVMNISFNSCSTLSNFAPDTSYSSNCSAFFCNSASMLSNFMHLQRFWGASGDFWQAQWDKILDKFGDDPVTLWVYGSLVLTIAVYWIVGGIYIILDITNRPAVLRRYKIQPGTNEPVDKRELCKVIAQVLFNQIVVGLPIMYLGYYFMEWRGYPPVRELPTFHWVLAEIAIHILCEEIGFYYSHRFLHKRSLYKYIHKQHHEWTAPIAVTALYCHPLENIGSNLLPPFLGVFIMGSHVATAWIWFSLAILSTLNAHSGYHLPFFPSPEAHDFHHLKFNQCYGVLGVLDRIHGTDTQFRNSRNYTRHIMMLSLIPPREAFPDEAKYKSK